MTSTTKKNISNEVKVATTEVATTEVATTEVAEVAATEVATTEVATTEVATSEVGARIIYTENETGFICSDCKFTSNVERHMLLHKCSKGLPLKDGTWIWLQFGKYEGTDNNDDTSDSDKADNDYHTANSKTN